MGKSQSFDLDHTMDMTSMSKMNDDRLRNGSISTISSKGFQSDGKDPKSLYESKAEKKSRYRSLFVAFVTMFVMSIGFSIVLTGVWPYMHSLNDSLGKEYVGWVVAASPLGQVLASPFLGWWGNKTGSIRIPCICTIVFYILGNAMYSLLSIFSGMGRYYGMIVSRLIVGISSANITLSRSYVAGATTIKERTIGISFMAASQALGFVVGPVIQAALTAIIPEPVDTGSDWFVWDKYTSCGWVAAFLGIINLIIFLPCVFEEHNIASKEIAMMESENENWKLPKPDMIGIVGILFINFIRQLTFTAIETLSEPLVQDEYGWSDDTALITVGIALAGGGLWCVVIITVTGIISRKYDERKILLFVGLPLLTLGSFLMLPWGNEYMSQQCPYATTTNLPMTTTPSNFTTEELHYKESMFNMHGHEYFVEGTPDIDDCSETGCPWDVQTWCSSIPQLNIVQLGISFFIFMCGYPVCQCILQGIYSKMLGPKPQGVWMGYFTGVGGTSRILGPIFVSTVYTFYGNYITFGVLSGAVVVAMLLVIFNYKRLTPMKLPTAAEEIHGYDGPAANENY